MRPQKTSGKPISRILSRMTIYLGPLLLKASSELPGALKRPSQAWPPICSCSAQSLPDFTTAELYLLSVALVLALRRAAVSCCAGSRSPDFPLLNKLKSGHLVYRCDFRINLNECLILRRSFLNGSAGYLIIT